MYSYVPGGAGTNRRIPILSGRTRKIAFDQSYQDVVRVLSNKRRVLSNKSKGFKSGLKLITHLIFKNALQYLGKYYSLWFC